MKITIEPTSRVEEFVTVTISNTFDDVDIYEACDMIRSALISWGFSPETVDENVNSSKLEPSE